MFIKPNKLPEKPSGIQTMVHILASLGGFLDLKADGHLGPLTIRRDLSQLSTIVKTLSILAPRG